MIKYDFVVVFFAEGQPVLKSAERVELEDSKEDQILPLERLDEMIIKKHENKPELKGFMYEKSELFLGNPEKPYDGGLIELDLKVTAEKMLERSNKCFGVKKPLVILRIFYVPK